MAVTTCLEPTQLELWLSTDLPCDKVRGTAVTVGHLGELEDKPASMSATVCERRPDGTSGLGMLVIVPSGENDGALALKVVAAVTAASPDDCGPSDVPFEAYRGCIVARRSLRYLPHNTVRLPVSMLAVCEGVACTPTSTCFKTGFCVPDGVQCGDLGCQLSADEVESFVDPGSAGSSGADGAGDAPGSMSGSGGGGDSGGAGGAAGAGGLGGAGDGCAGGMTECSGTCVDMGADPSNCGDCGKACGAGQACCDGTCADLSNNGLHCGACGHNCQGGGCFGATCQPVELAQAPGVPHVLTVDATHVYWTHENAGVGTVMRVPVTGGAPVTVAVTCPAYDIEVNAAHVYWTCRAPAVGVFRTSLGGGSPTLVVTGLEVPTGLALDATSVYVGDGHAVRKAPLEGGEAQQLAVSSDSRQVRVDGTHVYWANFASIRKVPIGGGPAVTLASGYFESSEIVIDTDNVYWITDETVSSSLNKVSKAGGAPVALASGKESLSYLAIDATHVYWSTYGAGGEVWRVPVGGGEPVVLAVGVAPRDLAVDATCVYWTDPSGRVMKLAK